MDAIRDRRFGCRRGFTIVELIVVIGILILLLAMLLPAVSGARRQARVVHCASNLRQICAALHTYAMTNKGQFPDGTTPGTGGNVWDVSHFFCTASQQLGLSYVTFLCPASQVDPSAAQAAFNTYNSFNIIQYNIWIPRLNGPDIIPPAPNYVGTRFLIVQPPPAPFAGPATAFDSSVPENPIITDIVATGGGVTPTFNADASAPNDPYQISGNSNHLNGKQLVGINAGYVDGHVEFHQGNEVHPYYRGNWWNWR